jgi:hypothetical protein
MDTSFHSAFVNIKLLFLLLICSKYLIYEQSYSFIISCLLALVASRCNNIYMTCLIGPFTCGLQSSLKSPKTGTADEGYYGCSVAIGSVGGHMVVGEYGYPQKAYVYKEVAGAWSLTDTLDGAKANFGRKVAIYDDTIIISNHDYDGGSIKGAAFVFKLITGK